MSPSKAVAKLSQIQKSIDVAIAHYRQIVREDGFRHLTSEEEHELASSTFVQLDYAQKDINALLSTMKSKVKNPKKYTKKHIPM